MTRLPWTTALVGLYRVLGFNGCAPSCQSGGMIAQDDFEPPERAPARLRKDPIILGELRFGILLLRQGKKRMALERWFDAGPWESETGPKWAQLLARLRTTGRAMPIKDSLIAATALTHDLIVATYNRSDFERAGVRIVDPFVRR